MKRKQKEELWVAVLMERGFVTEVKAYRSHTEALKAEKHWRNRLNPDYDETSVNFVTVHGD